MSQAVDGPSFPRLGMASAQAPPQSVFFWKLDSLDRPKTNIQYGRLPARDAIRNFSHLLSRFHSETRISDERGEVHLIKAGESAVV